MLDGFALGGSISSHSGVNCYPAMRADSDERYIVKTISVPASQVQLEALLLTGAYPYSGLYMMQHFMNNMFEQLNYQRLSAAAVLMALAMIVLIAILFAVENWFGKDVEG